MSSRLRFLRTSNATRERRRELLLSRRSSAASLPPEETLADETLADETLADETLADETLADEPRAETLDETPAPVVKTIEREAPPEHEAPVEHEDELLVAARSYSSEAPVALDVAPAEQTETVLEREPEERDASLFPHTARRARFRRIVTVALGACAVLCAVAAIRVVTANGPTSRGTSRPSLAAAANVETVAQDVSRVETSVADDRWADAAAAKRAALAALEAHRLEEATVAASAATALDPADGEAWLVLGAVLQDRGRMTEAIAAYRTCKEKGRVDPRGECSAMLGSLTKP